MSQNQQTFVKLVFKCDYLFYRGNFTSWWSLKWMLIYTKRNKQTSIWAKFSDFLLQELLVSMLDSDVQDTHRLTLKMRCETSKLWIYCCNLQQWEVRFTVSLGAPYHWTLHHLQSIWCDCVHMIRSFCQRYLQENCCFGFWCWIDPFYSTLELYCLTIYIFLNF